MEEKQFFQLRRTSSYRKRYDSEMNFSDYIDLYGVEPDSPRLMFFIHKVDHLKIQMISYLCSY